MQEISLLFPDEGFYYLHCSSPCCQQACDESWGQLLVGGGPGRRCTQPEPALSEAGVILQADNIVLVI